MTGASQRYLAVSLWAVAAAVLITGGAFGSVASVAAIVLTLLLAPAAFTPGAAAMVRAQPAMLAFLAVFVVLAIAFALTARDWMDFGYTLNFISLPLAPLVYLAARRAAGPGAVVGIAVLALAGALVAALYGSFQVQVMGAERAFALFGGPNLMPRVATICGFLALGALFTARGRWRAILLVGPALATVAVVLSGSRGAAIALPFAFVAGAIFILTNHSFRRPWLVVALLVAAALIPVGILVGLGALTGDPLAAFSRFGGIASTVGQVLGDGRTSDGATNLRLDMLWAASRAWFDAPILGHGWGNFAAAAAPYMDMLDPNFGGPDDPYFMFHNDLANFAVAAGLLGIACWLALLIAPVLGLGAVPRDGLSRVRAYVVMLLCVTYAVFGLTDMTLGYDLTTTLYVYVIAIALGAFREAPPAPGAAA